MSAPLLALALACGAAAPPGALVQPDLDATVVAKQVGSGEPVQLRVEAHLPDGWQVELQAPAAEGLTAMLVEEQAPAPAPGGTVRAWRYELTGPDGSYEILPAQGTATSPAGDPLPVQLDPVFVDIGVDGPLAQGLSDFEAAPPEAPFPWALLALAGGGLALLGVAIPLVARATRKAAPPPEPDPPHVVARAAWQAARGAGLPDHPQAVELSRVLRVYLESTTGWPATMRTGPEILAWMESDRVAGATARAHAARILSATDRLKFAREGGGDDFFAALDQDFEVVLEATRPVDRAPSAPEAR